MLGRRPGGAALCRRGGHPRPAAGDLRQLHSAVHRRHAQPHRRVLGGRAPRPQRQGRGCRTAAGDHRAADVEQRAREHEAPHGRRVI